MTMEREMNSVELEAAQRAEAVERLKMLERKGLYETVRVAFERDGRLRYSERAPFGLAVVGALFPMDGPSAVSEGGVPFADIVADFERLTGALVFFATHEFTPFGEILDLFYVSKDAWEWPRDTLDLAGGRAFVYAVNLTDEAMSDLGSIGFSVSGGGLIRIA